MGIHNIKELIAKSLDGLWEKIEPTTSEDVTYKDFQKTINKEVYWLRFSEEQTLDFISLLTIELLEFVNKKQNLGELKLSIGSISKAAGRARYQIRAALRKKERLPGFDLDAVSIENHSQRANDAVVLTEMIKWLQSKLEKDDFWLFMLIYEGASNNDLAKILGISKQTLAVRKHRLLNEIKQTLANIEGLT